MSPSPSPFNENQSDEQPAYTASACALQCFLAPAREPSFRSVQSPQQYRKKINCLLITWVRKGHSCTFLPLISIQCTRIIFKNICFTVSRSGELTLHLWNSKVSQKSLRESLWRDELAGHRWRSILNSGRGDTQRLVEWDRGTVQQCGWGGWRWTILSVRLHTGAERCWTFTLTARSEVRPVSSLLITSQTSPTLKAYKKRCLLYFKRGLQIYKAGHFQHKEKKKNITMRWYEFLCPDPTEKCSLILFFCCFFFFVLKNSVKYYPPPPFHQYSISHIFIPIWERSWRTKGKKKQNK